MAINKELYERYKAMKAAKHAAQEKEAVNTSTASNSQIEVSQQPLFNEDESKSTWKTSYTNPDDYSQMNFSNTTMDYSSSQITKDYNNQFSYTKTEINNNIEQNNQKNIIQKSPQKIKKFALIGYPLGHSLSEHIQKAGFDSLGINAIYELIPTKPEELVDRIKYIRSNGYSGFNVTIPLKLPVTMFLDEIDSSANLVKAINTVTINPQTNSLKGFNTDVIGFIKAIPDDISLYRKTIAILGTGGASRAAITALVQKQVKEIKLFTRNITNCIELLEYLRKTYSNITFNALQIDKFKDLSDIDMVVNATPIGMSGQAVGYSPLEEEEIKTLPKHALIYDIVYNPKKTNLIKLAQKNNYRTITGLDMLIYQAQESQKIWTGLTPDFKDMKIAALENLD